ncbi:MAG: hypothetical protein U9P73_07305, partial [Candidatus Cloacimonadota bacterium]|nr:hypothetical protein [Candidatus Cloacimonadota bacterium]
MNLRIGIDNCKPGWQIVLKQIGVSYTQFSLSDKISPDEYSVLIITDSHTSEENEVIEEYLNSGGAVLYLDTAISNRISHKTRKVRFLSSKKNTPFSSVGLVDIYSKIRIPRSKNIITIDSGLKITSVNHGVNLILPFNINELILSNNSRRKKFYANRKELPSEIVSEVSKGKIRKIVEIALEYLHHKRDLPFVHLWHQPYIDKNLFIFRLDTDFCSKKDADEMYKICKDNNVSATWFLDTDSDERMINYASMKDQEMAIHCDKHYVYDNSEKNYDNILTAKKKLKSCGINADGFAAPFGDWNLFLNKALQKLELKYSSEFTLDYDDLPFYPYCNNEFSSVIQIPIHPISLGRLNRSHFNEDEMLKYYFELIRKKSENDEPIIIYHHPHHKHFDIFNKIFQYVNSPKFENMNMGEF